MGLVPQRSHSRLGGSSSEVPEAAPLHYLVGMMRVLGRSQSLLTNDHGVSDLLSGSDNLGQPLASQIPLDLSEV